MAESKKSDAGQAEVQETFDQAADEGLFGRKVDPTPDEHYTVDGVTSGKPTPETDPEQRAKALAVVRGED